MLAQINSCSLIGLNVNDINIEVDAAGGLPSWDIVGLPDTAVKESKERVRTAIKNSGLEFPPRRIVVNLAPASIRKEGPSFDLAIAIAILKATDQIQGDFSRYIFLGELGLDGTLRTINGSLAVSLHYAATDKILVVPQAVAAEATIGGCTTYGFSDLKEVLQFLKHPEGFQPHPPIDYDALLSAPTPACEDFANIKGQEQAKRALEIAAAGGHNVILIGSPGSGKSMLAKAFPSILPPLTLDEAIESTNLYSIAGLLPEHQPLLTTRPFRAPHHSASSSSIIGGGKMPLPGEISLSHNGVLFLDELPEFRKDVLEGMRQPLENHTVTVSRVAAQITYPCNCILLAAMNPCPCGYFNDPIKQCTCTPHQAQRYRNRISGPFLDRIDIQLEVTPVDFQALHDDSPCETSAQIRTRVIAARNIQTMRYQNSQTHTNSAMTTEEIKKYCKLSQSSQAVLEKAFTRMGLSARGHNRILKIARTIADLEHSPNIETHHITEALQYRTLDKSIWQ